MHIKTLRLFLAGAFSTVCLAQTWELGAVGGYGWYRDPTIVGPTLSGQAGWSPRPAVGVVFGPALAAVTLGIVGHRAFTKRIGRNESFNHAGNACAAAAAGALAYFWGPKVVFFLLASMAIASIVSVLAIPKRAIDHDLARGLHDSKSSDERPSGLSVLLTCRPLIIFAGCAIMFHFANAAMLPLVGQKLALQDKNLGN